MEDKYRRAIVEWHFQFDNPDFRGWSVVAAYVIAAAICAQTAWLSRRKASEEERFSALWWLLACGLLFLGINKQLNLQGLFIVLGRRAAFAGGWYERRRLIQTLFMAALTVAGVAALWLLRAVFRPFFARHPWTLTGTLVLFLFILIRAASINHVLTRVGLSPHDAQGDKKWTWILEIGGSACLALAATRAARISTKR